MLEQLILGIEWYVIFLFSTICHEAAHALVALKLGDRTAYYGGQVSLDPIPHIRREPFGTVIVPILSYLVGGWMIGWATTPYNPIWAIRYPRRAAWMALAGPVANLLLVVVSAMLIRIGLFFHVFEPPASITFTGITGVVSNGWASGVAVILSIMFSLNLLLAVFNMIPFPPLDGSGVLSLLMREDTALRYMQMLRNPMFSYIGLLFAWKMSGPLLAPIHLGAINLLYAGITSYS